MKEPPKLALKLLDLFVPVSERESIPGDLMEELQAIASEKTERQANRWFWMQVVRSIGAVAWMNARAATGRTLGAILAGLLVLGSGAAVLLASFVAGVEYELGRYGLSSAPALVGVAFAGWLVLGSASCCASAAYVSSRLARGGGPVAVMALGFSLTVLFTIWTRVALFPDSEPLAGWLSALVLLISWPAMLAGGYMAARRHRATRCSA